MRSGPPLLVVALVLLVGLACTSAPTDEAPAATSIAIPPPGGFPTAVVPDSFAVLHGGCPATLPNGRVIPAFASDRGDPRRHAVGEMARSSG